MQKRILGILLYGYMVILLVGCANLAKKDKPITGTAILEPQAVVKFSDLPVPVGFKQIIEDSYSFENAGVRVAVLRYQGKAQINQVINFYKEQMLMYNWNFLNIIEYGESVLNFDRDNETCIITLTPKGNSVLITISLGPKSPIYRKSKEPVK